MSGEEEICTRISDNVKMAGFLEKKGKMVSFCNFYKCLRMKVLYSWIILEREIPGIIVKLFLIH